MGSALELAFSVLSQLPAFISTGMDVVNLIKGTADTIKKAQDENRDPTDEEWTAINQIIDSLRAQLHAP